MFAFRSLGDEDLALGTSYLMGYEASRPGAVVSDDFTIARAQFRGALLALFGPPIEGGDCRINYVIEAADAAGGRWILTAYEGKYSPSIGGDGDVAGIEAAARALCELIRATSPSDFSDTYFDSEYSVDISYGCVSGRCFYTSEYVDLGPPSLTDW